MVNVSVDINMGLLYITCVLLNKRRQDYYV